MAKKPSQTPAEAKAGVHYRVLAGELSKTKKQALLSVLDRPEILSALRQKPLQAIYMERLQTRGISGFYDAKEQSITVNTVRRLGSTHGEPFRPGRIGNMSAATNDRMESMRRTLIQELAHHLEHSYAGVRKLVTAAEKDAARKPITRYATQPGEYFPETLIAYLVERDALAQYDPVGFKMVEEVLELLHS